VSRSAGGFAWTKALLDADRPTALDFSEHGYGLHAIMRPAYRTGVRGNSAVGHAVWAELLLDG
jgi:hypothetical protein